MAAVRRPTHDPQAPSSEHLILCEVLSHHTSPDESPLVGIEPSKFWLELGRRTVTTPEVARG
jgi:hypothetical protein